VSSSNTPKFRNTFERPVYIREVCYLSLAVFEKISAMIPVSESKAGEYSRGYSQDKRFRRDRDVQYSPFSIFVQRSKKKMSKDDAGNDMARARVERAVPPQDRDVMVIIWRRGPSTTEPISSLLRC
jgi:hypothetical protein